MPALAKYKSEAGQHAFIEYWLDTYNYMRETGDTEPFLAACHKDSLFCIGSAEASRKLAARKGWRVGGRVALHELTIESENSETKRTVWNGSFEEAPISFSSDRGEIEFGRPHEQAERNSVVLVLGPTDLGWQVLDLGADSD